MSEEIPPVAKDLISKLLLPQPEDRLGNGKPGSGKEMKDLKNHPFFASFSFDEFN